MRPSPISLSYARVPQAVVSVTLIFLLWAFSIHLASAQLTSQTVYDDQLENGWQDWGWVTNSLTNTSPVHSGSDSISVSIGATAWGGLSLHSAADFDSSPYSSVSFWINGGATGGQMLQVRPDLGGNPGGTFYLAPLPGGNVWQQVTIPLSSLGAAQQPNFDGIFIQDATGNGGEATFYLDDISLNANDQVIYDDSTETGWHDYSWATTSDSSTALVHNGADSVSVSVTGAWQALYFNHPEFNDSAFSALQFWINGGAAGGQRLQVYSFVGGVANATPVSLPALAANTWQLVTVPLSSIAAANVPNLDGFFVQDATGGAQPVFYVDDVTLLANQIQSVSIAVDANANKHAISPLVYGVALGYPDISPPVDPTDLSDLNVPLNRQGGDNTSTYNWQINSRSSAADWYFESGADPSTVPGGTADQFVTDTRANGAQPMLTIPMVGWVAKVGANRSPIPSYSVANYGAQQASDPYWSDAGDGILPNGSFVNNDPNDAYVPANVAYQQPWVNHLLSKWGTAANGGVPYYIMDNEVSIWFSTHRDIHPVGPTMDEIYNDIVAYGSMVKAADPSALVVAPEEWGWNAYFYSGYDQQWASANGWNFNAAPDRTAHNGADYLPWLLQQLAAYQQSSGKRLVDVFTVHFYPGGAEFGTDVSDATENLRNRSTRQLWDPGYVAESWINATVDLVPRIKGWVQSYYPGTKTGLTEYNWGGDASMNGATTQADILGILGREGLDLATRWQVPDRGTPTYEAMKIWRNYDGAKSTFGDTSVSDQPNSNPDGLSSFAAVRSSDGYLTVMIIDKVLSGPNAPVTVNLANFNAAGIAHAWQVSGAGSSIDPLSDISFSGSSLSVNVPPQSVTLLVIPPVDNIAPTTAATLSGTAGSDGWFVGAVKVTLSATDNLGGSGIAATYYKIDGGVKKTYTAPFKITANGNHSVVYWSVDKAGNIETQHTQVVMIDLTKPVSSASVSGSAAPATVTITATDNLSGVSATYYMIGAGAKTAYTAPFAVKSAGNKTVTYWSVDAAGNIEAKKTLLFTLSPQISGFTITPATVNGGTSATGKATLNVAAPTGGASVSVSSNSAAATVPANVTVAAGALSASFTIATTTVSAKTTATITVSNSASSKQKVLTVKSP